MFCKNCGNELIENAKFCNTCGTPIIEEEPVQAPTPPVSAPMENDAQENKVVNILAYILFFLPLVASPGSKSGRYHANQGLVLLITSILGGIVLGILDSIILAISWRLWGITSALNSIWGIVIFILAIIGMINANKGDEKPLPVIGKISIIK